MKLITASAYSRAHCRRPRGCGHWAFQASRSWDAYETELFGEQFVSPKRTSLNQAKRDAIRFFAFDEDVDFIAVLP
jgi:hypothetical protein